MIELRLLGSLDLRGPEGRPISSLLAQPKRLALLAYLCTATPRGFHRRDKLLGLFWPESDTEHARNSLRKSIHLLRRSLGAATIVTRGDEEVGVVFERLVCDVVLFEEAAKADRFEDALDLYRGDLLEGFFLSDVPEFEKWLDAERGRLRRAAATAARLAAERHEAVRNVTAAVGLARRAVEFAGEDERALRRLIELLDRLGDRAGAVHAYESFAQRLEREHGTEASPETRALIAGVRAREAVLPSADLQRLGQRSAPSAPRIPGYDIERELARGGMATVYVACEAKHGRSVAVKVIRLEYATTLGYGSFLREIQLTAQLAHPNILPLLDSGTVDGLPFYVMPFVSGESLRARLNWEGPLEVGVAVRLVCEAAEALHYAHRRGIVHCDIKPENILLEEGHAIVADFGVARALTAHSGAERGESQPTIVFGSRAYMSPEQIQGREVDARSDVYALACVLYELLAGEPGGAQTQRPTKQLRTRRPDVPIHVLDTIERALAPAPEDRPATARDFEQALRSEVMASTRGPVMRPWRLGLVAASVILAAVAAWRFAGTARNGSFESQPASPAIAATFVVPLPEGQVLASRTGLAVAVSPDGKQLVYAADTRDGRRLYSRPIHQINAIPIAGTDGAIHPFFSADGRWIGFYANGYLRRVPSSGGVPITIARVEGGFGGASWASGDTVLFSQTETTNAGVYRVPAYGGAAQRIATPMQGESELIHPIQVPGGAVLVTVRTGMGLDEARIAALDPVTGERVALPIEGQWPRYAPSGHIVFANRFSFTRVFSLHAIPFDPRTTQVTGASAVLVDSVLFLGSTGAAQFDISRDGMLLYVAPRGGPLSHSLLWVSPEGRAERIDLPRQMYGAPAISPDERRVALTILGDSLAAFILEVDRQLLSPLALDLLNSHSTIWSPNGDRVVFSSVGARGPSNLYMKWVDDRAPVQRLTTNPQHQDPSSWSPDGKYIAFVQDDPESQWDIYLLDMSTSAPESRPLIQSDFREHSPMISPNGRWLAYVSEESGRPQVYVERFPDLGAKQQVSSFCGDEPLWSRDGETLYYTTRSDSTCTRDSIPSPAGGAFGPEGSLLVWAVRVATRGGLELGRPELLMEGGSNSVRSWGRPRYDVSRDGRFLVVRRDTAVPAAVEFVTVLDWPARLGAQIPGASTR